LIGYLAKPSTQSMLLKFADPDETRPIRLAAIAGLRRIVAQSETKGTEKVIEALIDFADGDDVAVAQSAVDTLRGARIPETLAKSFASLAKSRTSPRSSRWSASPRGWCAAVKRWSSIAGDEPTARRAARGLKGLRRAGVTRASRHDRRAGRAPPRASCGAPRASRTRRSTIVERCE
jgi:hypothetical protein